MAKEQTGESTAWIECFTWNNHKKRSMNCARTISRCIQWMKAATLRCFVPKAMFHVKHSSLKADDSADWGRFGENRTTSVMFHVKQKDGADKKVIDKNPTDEMQHKSAAYVLLRHTRRSYKLIRKGNFAGKTCKYNGTNRNDGEDNARRENNWNDFDWNVWIGISELKHWLKCWLKWSD